MKKRYSFVILCAVFSMGLLLGACNSQKPGSETENPSESQGSEVVTTYTVTFNSNGGSDVASQTVKKGEKATKPTNPTKEGFTFGNWFEDNVLVTPYDFNTPVTSSFTLFASWTKNTEPPIPPEPVTTDYYAVIGAEKVAMTADTERIAENQTGNYICTFASISEGQTISFLDADEVALSNYGPDMDYESYHNNVLNDGGTYKVHNDASNVKVTFRSWEDGGYSFWIDGYEDTTPIVTEEYYLYYDGVYTKMSVDESASLAQNQLAQYHVGISPVVAGSEIYFADSQQIKLTNIGSDIEDATNKNNVDTVDGRYYIHTGCDNDGLIDFYLKKWSNGGYSFWVTGYQSSVDPVEPSTPHGPEGSDLVSWYLVGKGSLWSYDWNVEHGVQLYSNPDNVEDKGCILSVTFAVDDIFKVTDGTTWYGYEKIDTFVSDDNYGLKNFTSDPDGFNGQNIKCAMAGTYDIYVNKTGTFWITNYQA